MAWQNKRLLRCDEKCLCIDPTEPAIRLGKVMNAWTLCCSISALGVAFFGVSYYRNCYRLGYRIDLWHAHLFLFCVFPYMLMLPFARNELNAIIVGQDFAGVVAAVPHVFLVAMAGYFAVLTSGSLWYLHAGMGLRRATGSFLDRGPRCSEMLMSSRSLLLFLSALCLAAQLLVVFVYFSRSGFGFNLRAYTFENPGIRPVAQIIALSSMVVISHSMARYLDTKERPLLVVSLLLTFGLLFFGQRGNLIFAYMNLVICYVIARRSSIGMLRIAGLTITALGLIFYLGNVRQGLYSPTEFFTSIIFLAFYGNNFCDLRDFAWIYSHWNQQLWLGKTYLAGIATFLPRSVSDFRGTWSFGVATDWTVGLDTELHPGLKPGEFGEAFFNFGLVGVVVAGFLIGILVRRADMTAKHALEGPQPSMVRAFASTMLISLALCLNTSLGIPAIYALAMMYVLGWIWLRIRASLYPQQGFGMSSVAPLPAGLMDTQPLRSRSEPF